MVWRRANCPENHEKHEIRWTGRKRRGAKARLGRKRGEKTKGPGTVRGYGERAQLCGMGISNVARKCVVRSRGNGMGSEKSLATTRVHDA